MQNLLLQFAGILFVLMPLSSYALVPDPVHCVRDLESNFFRRDIVYKSLSLYQIPQGLWEQISTDLQTRNQSVLDRMKKKTARMVPNPIEYPMQKIPTAQLLIAVLHEVFMETMTLYEVNEQPSADLVFNYILAKQGDRFEICFGPQVKELLPKTY